MRRIIPGLLALAISLISLPSPAAGGRDEAGQAAERFARTLRAGEPSELHAILPKDGKILVSMAETGSGAGYYGASQVEALFGSYLAGHRFRECRIDHFEIQEPSYARVDLTAVRDGPDDERVTVFFRLALHLEQERWVLREIRESTQ